MPLVVRTWNLFHGNTVPPGRRAYLREMVELVSDGADIVCLQEVPVWATTRLERWSGMQAVSAIARAPRLRNAELGRLLTELNHGVLRSAVTGEAGAILVAPGHVLGDPQVKVVSSGGLRRIAHSVLVDGEIRVVNFHTTGEDQLRAVGDLAGDGQAFVAGDANIRSASLPGFSRPLEGSIDQILVRGLPSAAPFAWPPERRGNLSDHAPVELTVG